jgi:hypothetical protein
MADIEQSAPHDASNKVVSLLVRAVASFNLLVIALGFTETGERAGLSEELFGWLRFGGFRLDFVWLCFSTVALFGATFLFLADAGKSGTAKVNAAFCIAGVLAFCIYIGYVLLSGVLYFG